MESQSLDRTCVRTQPPSSAFFMVQSPLMGLDQRVHRPKQDSVHPKMSSLNPRMGAGEGLSWAILGKTCLKADSDEGCNSKGVFLTWLGKAGNE